MFADELWVFEGNTQPTTLSIIVPTRNESGNVLLLLTKLKEALVGVSAEIIFVDDSDDDTAERIQLVAKNFPFRIAVNARPPERRANGLGGAVVEGFHLAHSPWLCVMDADLQHPPAMVMQLLAKAQQKQLDIVMGTRLKAGGGTQGLNFSRYLVSYILALTTRLTFPMRLWRVSDPLTGLFVIRNGSVDWGILRPDGFKILLEILVRSPKLKLGEVPFHFDHRHAGESKASVHELYRLIRHYVRLRWSADSYLVYFILVDWLGSLISYAFYLVGGKADWRFSQLIILLNFFLMDRFVFVDRRQSNRWQMRFVGFWLISSLAWWLRTWIPGSTTIGVSANFLAVAALSFGRFVVCDLILWKRLRNQPLTRTP